MLRKGKSDKKASGGHVYSGRKDVRRINYLQLLAGILIILALNVIGSARFARFDMTTERRYSLTDATKDMLRGLDDVVYFRVYLEGSFPAGFRRLRNQTREMLDEFRAYSDYIEFEFINPTRAGDREQISRTYEMLMDKGLEPTQLQVRGDDATSQQVIFPGALVSYGGKEAPLKLLQDQMGIPPEEVLNNSAQALEYNIASVIRQLTATEKEKVGFLEGQGEYEHRYVADITQSLGRFYDVERVRINERYQNIEDFKTLIVADPVKPFSEEDKFILDQFLMNGGSLLWLVDPVFADMDSLRPPDYETIGMGWPINLDDMLFNYGIRLNPDLLQDLNAAPIPVTTGYVGSRPQISLLPWHFFPLVSPASDHPIVKNLNLVRTEFVSSIDTVAAEDVDKTFLLHTSRNTRVLQTPTRIALDILQNPPDERLFREGPKPVAALLEGSFESVFRNRIPPEVDLPADFKVRDKSEHTAMVVVADGDIIRNQFERGNEPLPLGYDRYSGENFGNKDFILNAVNYLTDDSGLIEARAKELRLRMLDKTRIGQNRLGVQILNLLLPVLLVFVFGVLRIFWRKRRYSR